MRGSLSFEVEARSIQHLTALREKAAAVLSEEVTVIATASSQRSHRFTVLGADTATKKAWRKSVEATNEEAAVKEAVDDDKRQVVVDVRLES